jgi:SOS response regulatory protein OraA/RecX
MRNILCEKQIITSKINNYINKWKNTFYIKSKLYEKGFVKDEYEEIFNSEFNVEEKSILNYEKVYKQINILYKKNKSKNYIRNKYIENSFDRELIESILEDIFVDWEEKSLKIELDKILRKLNKQRTEALCWQNEFKSILDKIDFKEKQKITQKLVWKWFNFWEVIEILNN